MKVLPTPLTGLAEFNQFILWKAVPKNGKIEKIPVDKFGTNFIDPHNSANWMSFQEASQYVTDFLYIGFVFTKKDPLFFIDIDKCLQENGQWSELATELCTQFQGCAIEISHSNTGIHIIGRAEGAIPEHRCKNIRRGIEMYSKDRFIALTGRNAIGDVNHKNDAVLHAVINRYFQPKDPTKENEPTRWTITHHPDSDPIKDDHELISKALKSASAANKFGNGIRFKDLWNKNLEALESAFPMDTRTDGITFDVSQADASLAQRLAFWTGNNCERIKKLMFDSALVREKWNREIYVRETILNAVGRQKSFYKPRNANSRTLENTSDRSGFQYMTIDAQKEFFKGCVYIIDLHKIFTPCGMLLKPDQFNATYAGYVFQMSQDGGTRDTRKPWEAFIDSQGIRHPRVNKDAFRPDLKPGEIFEMEGKTYVNSYIPIKTRTKEFGDTSMFDHFFTKLLPIETDREILWSYMAACIQYPGVKFQWCPLIQGAEGNGKTLLTRLVCFCIGEDHSHMPPAHEIGEKHNEWLFNKLFIGVEDVYVPSHKVEIIEILKPMITGERLSMRAMAKSQTMRNNTANFILNSNHKNALPTGRDARRLCFLYTAQQTAADIIRDGMGGDYFPKLYAWLRHDGYALLNHKLRNFKIKDEYNPATLCMRAPKTSSYNESIEYNLGPIEQEILEAIEENQPGFCGGWVSSMALDKMLRDKNLSRRVPNNLRRLLMSNLGYVPHPGLHNGRVNNRITFDGGKPRLYIKDGHLNMNLTNPGDIARKYESDQLSQLTAYEARGFK